MRRGGKIGGRMRERQRKEGEREKRIRARKKERWKREKNKILLRDKNIQTGQKYLDKLLNKSTLGNKSTEDV
jgi:hypothetical protein